MPAEFSIDPSANLVRSLALGTLTDKDLLAHQLRLAALAARFSSPIWLL